MPGLGPRYALAAAERQGGLLVMSRQSEGSAGRQVQLREAGSRGGLVLDLRASKASTEGPLLLRLSAEGTQLDCGMVGVR